MNCSAFATGYRIRSAESLIGRHKKNGGRSRQKNPSSMRLVLNQPRNLVMFWVVSGFVVSVSPLASTLKMLRTRSVA